MSVVYNSDESVVYTLGELGYSSLKNSTHGNGEIYSLFIVKI